MKKETARSGKTGSEESRESKRGGRMRKSPSQTKGRKHKSRNLKATSHKGG